MPDNRAYVYARLTPVLLVHLVDTIFFLHFRRQKVRLRIWDT
jgi:hypothetical protein